MPVSKRTRSLLWRCVQEPDNFQPFVVFDAGTRRVAVNISHAVYYQFDPPLADSMETATVNDPKIVAFFERDAEPLSLLVAPDKVSLKTFDDNGMDDDTLCQVANFFHYLEATHEGSDYTVMLFDAVGCITWLRLNEISFASAPLELLA